MTEAIKCEICGFDAPCVPDPMRCFKNTRARLNVAESENRMLAARADLAERRLVIAVDALRKMASPFRDGERGFEFAKRILARIKQMPGADMVPLQGAVREEREAFARCVRRRSKRRIRIQASGSRGSDTHSHARWEVKLKPCPFCGEPFDGAPEDYLSDDELGDVWMECVNCQARGPATRIGCRDDECEDGLIDINKEAVDMWNKRGAK